jgi:hypothetical protein
MLVEVGKTYVNRAGNICKVLSRTDPFSQAIPAIHVGFDTYYSYFPLEDGREKRETSYQVDRFGSHLGESDSHDLISEYKMPDLQWAWCQPDKNGLWAYGGDRDNTTPVLSGIDTVLDYSPTRARLNVWRCYLGPIPQIAQPKKLVKQTLWMVKYYTTGTWEELWLPDGGVPKFKSFHDIGHKTCTTRTV